MVLGELGGRGEVAGKGGLGRGHAAHFSDLGIFRDSEGGGRRGAGASSGNSLQVKAGGAAKGY